MSSEVKSSSPVAADAPASAALLRRQPTVPPLAATSSRAAKSKKKKGGGAGGANGAGENTGRWTAEEHRLFLQGLDQHGKGWKKIASLIKSRTVVQIRTHAQKYFQKLAKARQNGEEGEIVMEGARGGFSSAVHSMTGGGGMVSSSKRRRASLAGTKRKVISSVVHSAQKEGKKMALEGLPPPLPVVTPALANFLLPARDNKLGQAPSLAASQGNISGAALEDSIFRFLTPAPVALSDAPMLNDVARQAGANPIMLPTDHPGVAPVNGSGEVSPVGVADISIYPSWTDAKDPPSWYTNGADVDALLEVAGSLDWLEDSGDLHEHFEAPPVEDSPDMPDIDVSPTKLSMNSKVEEDAMDQEDEDMEERLHLSTISSSAELPQTMDEANVEEVVPPLPSIFDGAPNSDEHLSDLHPPEVDTEPHPDESEEDTPMAVASASTSDLIFTSNISSAKLTLKDDDAPTSHVHDTADGELGDGPLFDSEMEHDFVSTILENSESAADLAALH